MAKKLTLLVRKMPTLPIPTPLVVQKHHNFRNYILSILQQNVWTPAFEEPHHCVCNDNPPGCGRLLRTASDLLRIRTI